MRIYNVVALKTFQRVTIGENLEVWKRFGNINKNWKFGGKMEISKKFGNLIKIWKVGKDLEIWKKRLENWKEIENLENIWKFEKIDLKIWEKM